MKKYFKKVLKSIDIFGQPICLQLDMKQQFKTGCGGFLTLILTTLLIYIGFDGFINMMSYKNLYSSTTTLYVKDPEFIKLRMKEQPFAISFDPSEYNNWGENKYFEIDLEEILQTRYDNGSLIKTRRKIELQLCQIWDFPSFEEEFKLLGMKNWLCPLNDSTFTIGGDFSSKYFSYVRFRVTRCQNSTGNNNSCVSNENFNDTIFNNEGKIRFRIHFVNKIIELENFDTPYSTHLKSNLFFNLDPNKEYKTADIFFRPNEINTDRSLVSFQKSVETIVTYNEEMREQHSTTTNRDVIGEFFIRMSNTKLRHNRSYTKLGTFLAYIGGFWTSLYLIAEAMAKNYNQRSLFLKLANKLYNFKIEAKSAKTLRQQKAEASNPKKNQPEGHEKDANIKTEAHKIKPEEVIRPELSGGISPTTPVSLKSKFILIGRINTYMAGFKKLTTTITWDLLQTCFPFFFNKEARSSKLILYEKAMDLIGKDLDVLHILTKFQELDKLKHILLDKEQRILFEFCPRQVVSDICRKNEGKKQSRVLSSRFSMIFQERRDSRRTSWRRNSWRYGKTKDMELPFYLDLYKSFELVKNRNFQNDVDDKLLELMGPDILNIFEKHRMEMDILQEDDPLKKDEKCLLLKKLTEEFKVNRRPSEFEVKRLTTQNFKLKWQGVKNNVRELNGGLNYFKADDTRMDYLNIDKKSDGFPSDLEAIQSPPLK